MEFSGTDYTGWKDGKCRWISVKFSGKGADAKNAKTVADMARKGYEIRELPTAEAVAAHMATFDLTPTATHQD